MQDISELQAGLGVTFKNIKLLQQAVVHRSFLNEHPDFELDHNERLEFLGDAVLEIVVTDFLYRTYPNPEGELTSIRSALVNTDMIALLSRKAGIEPFLMLSHGESKDTGRARDVILANAFEAVIGSIYLDQGMEAAHGFISRFVFPHAQEIVDKKLYRDPKSTFQELAQEKHRVTPDYKVLEESGPDHSKLFVVGLYLGEELIAKGEGSSKQLAQVDAARKALLLKKW